MLKRGRVEGEERGREEEMGLEERLPSATGKQCTPAPAKLPSSSQLTELSALVKWWRGGTRKGKGRTAPLSVWDFVNHNISQGEIGEGKGECL